MMRKTDREGLVLLSFDAELAATQLRWEHDREFEFEGMMYDVVEAESCEGMVHYWCWPDGEETSLNRLLEELVAFATSADGSNQNERNSQLDFYASLFVEEVTQRYVETAESNAMNFELQASYPVSFLQSPDTPPPDRG